MPAILVVVMRLDAIANNTETKRSFSRSWYCWGYVNTTKRNRQIRKQPLLLTTTIFFDPRYCHLEKTQQSCDSVVLFVMWQAYLNAIDPSDFINGQIALDSILPPLMVTLGCLYKNIPFGLPRWKMLSVRPGNLWIVDLHDIVVDLNQCISFKCNWKFTVSSRVHNLVPWAGIEPNRRPLNYRRNAQITTSSFTGFVCHLPRKNQHCWAKFNETFRI